MFMQEIMLINFPRKILSNNRGDKVLTPPYDAVLVLGKVASSLFTFTKPNKELDPILFSISNTRNGVGTPNPKLRETGNAASDKHF